MMRALSRLRGQPPGLVPPGGCHISPIGNRGNIIVGTVKGRLTGSALDGITVSPALGPAIDAYAARALRRPAELAGFGFEFGGITGRLRSRSSSSAPGYQVRRSLVIVPPGASDRPRRTPLPGSVADQGDAPCRRRLRRWRGVGLVVDARAAGGSHAATPSWHSRRSRS